MDSVYILNAFLPVQTEYQVATYFNFTLTDLKIDTFVDMLTFTGYMNATYKDLSIPLRITQPLLSSSSSHPNKNFTLIIEPYLDTMEVSTFYNIF